MLGKVRLSFNKIYENSLGVWKLLIRRMASLGGIILISLKVNEQVVIERSCIGWFLWAKLNFKIKSNYFRRKRKAPVIYEKINCYNPREEKKNGYTIIYEGERERETFSQWVHEDILKTDRFSLHSFITIAGISLGIRMQNGHGLEFIEQIRIDRDSYSRCCCVICQLVHLYLHIVCIILLLLL